MNNDDFDRIMDGVFDPMKLAVEEAVETYKKVIEGVKDVHDHASDIGFSEKMADSIALAFLTMSTTSEEPHDGN